MRFSPSLQDLKTYSKAGPAESEIDLESNRGYSPGKPRVLQRDGAASSFSKERTLSSWKKWKRATICFTVILLLLLIFVCSRYFTNSLSREASKYYVILDCGSTGTRVYVYEWSIAQSNGRSNLPIVLKSLPEGVQSKSTSRSGRAYQRMETEPGFDKLVRNVTGLSAAIKPLLQWAKKQIPKHAHKSSSIYLYATAGVRRLPKADSEWLLDKALSILKNSPFSCRGECAKIITGMEEAYYGWIALNHHMGMLGSSSAKETFGALDLGGSSLQVTFETKQPIHDETGIDLGIGAVNHHLSAYSLSGYGLNDAFDKSVVHILKRQGTTKASLKSGKIEIKHPCLQTGYREEYICSQCAALGEEGSPQIGGGAADKGGPKVAIKLIGAPHWEQCSSLAKATVNLSEWSGLTSGIDCEFKPCALSENLPQPRGQFYAMSGFYVVFKFFNLTSDAVLDEVLQLGQEYCRKTWEVAKVSVAPQPFIEQYCFRAPYIVSLLRDGLHISDKQVVVGSGSISWTLGVALMEAGKTLPSRIELSGYGLLNQDISPTIVYGMLLLSVIVLFCALACVSNWMPKIFGRFHLPLFRNSNTATSVRNISYPFNFQRWSPINSGDGRVKLPLSPTIAGSQQHPFSPAYGFGGSSIQLLESSLHQFGVSHSYSSGSLPQMQFGSGIGSWIPSRGQTLQSRRSQSREDLVSSLAEAYMVKP